MKKGLAADIRVVICPKCSNRLAEPTGVPFYICGGCETILQSIFFNSAEQHSQDLNSETQHRSYDNSDLLRFSNSYDMDAQATSSNDPCTAEVKLRDLAIDDGKPEQGMDQRCEEPAVLTTESSNPLPKQQEELSEKQFDHPAGEFEIQTVEQDEDGLRNHRHCRSAAAQLEEIPPTSTLARADEKEEQVRTSPFLNDSIPSHETAELISADRNHHQGTEAEKQPPEAVITHESSSSSSRVPQFARLVGMEDLEPVNAEVLNDYPPKLLHLSTTRNSASRDGNLFGGVHDNGNNTHNTKVRRKIHHHHLSASGHSFNLRRIGCEPSTSSNFEFNHRTNSHHLPPPRGYRDHHVRRRNPNHLCRRDYFNSRWNWIVGENVPAHHHNYKSSSAQINRNPSRYHQYSWDYVPSCTSSYSHIPYPGDAPRDSSGSRFSPSHNASPSMQFFHPSSEMRRWSYQFSPHNRRCRDGGQGGNSLTSLKQPFDFHPISLRVNKEDAWGNRDFPNYRYHMAAAQQHSGETRIHPVANGAPFITCYHCSNVLQLPSDILLFHRTSHRLKCDACWTILKFQLKNGKHLVPCDSTPETVTSTAYISQVTQRKNSSEPQSHVRDEVEQPSNETKLPGERRKQQGSLEREDDQRKGKKVIASSSFQSMMKSVR